MKRRIPRPEKQVQDGFYTSVYYSIDDPEDMAMVDYIRENEPGVEPERVSS
ncbi:MAG: hypothetical protein MZU79_01450 [Anaerotruncus sp.]|nr:hypothetical protein [Anaerotruncus sp.]